jgi:hypothetical protein
VDVNGLTARNQLNRVKIIRQKIISVYLAELSLIDWYHAMNFESHLALTNDHEFAQVRMFSTVHVVKFLFPIDFAFDVMQQYPAVVLV